MSKKQKILITAAHKGAVNAVKPVAENLNEKYDLVVYATGNKNQISAFEDVPYRHISPSRNDYRDLVKGTDLVVTGLSGRETPDGYFIRAANEQGIPSLGVSDPIMNYFEIFGNDKKNWPTLLATTDERAEQTIREGYKSSLAEELIARSRIVGWITFDPLAELRKSFDKSKRISLLNRLGLNSEKPIHLHLTQNSHPQTEYMQLISRDETSKQNEFEYELKVTEEVFRAASGMSLNLIVKPHPGEKFHINFTKELAERYGFRYISPDEYDTKQCILSVDSISVGRSTCLLEACLLDKNVAGIFPDIDHKTLQQFVPVPLQAVPYAQTWECIPEILQKVSSTDPNTSKMLAEKRKRFSVDGKATQRLMNVVKSLL